eukprot:Gregarina_sp_Poly_1__10187@NODE_700_length_6689_cov_270_629719_g528_i0_p1_GENE_NODE_700_length_6689_cov_270_629719_g528_i0NODE_700_length_6689_cov_270_629719_g528_i0_p1_ORF_typecomplete_len677_score101_24PUF/PF00806_19/22PUF/PF00806_19/1_5e07PUF/PF00806_19/5e06PUF/PF00806_19/3_1e10PUF/PF00806_19/1_5e08PUF/PF00806_19/1_3e08PUF/PF00806_19/0_00046PUF/PF00806_19/0_00019DUF842/PF05811_13/0_066DUF842/PF05811_13/7_7e02OSCP/PF00213_18/2_9e03OSCP/PF00213_18/0_27CAS_CSE1/PF03378_15/3_9e02CAS_CSE1/PF03378_
MFQHLLDASGATGPETWEDLSTTASRDPASPSRSLRTAVAAGETLPTWMPWQAEDSAPALHAFDDFFDTGTPTPVTNPDAIIIPSPVGDVDSTGDQNLLNLKADMNGDFGADDCSNNSLSDLVSPALIAQALNVLGASSMSTHDTFSPVSGSRDNGVAEAAQLLAQLLECSDSTALPASPRLGAGGFSTPSHELASSDLGGSPLSLSPGARRAHNVGFSPLPLKWSHTDAGDGSGVLSPRAFSFHSGRRGSTVSASTPRSPSTIGRPPPPPKENDASPAASWGSGGWGNRRGEAFVVDAPKRTDNSPWASAPEVVDRDGRSKVLTDFRNGSLQINNLYQIEKYMIEFSRDQMGARFIQQRLSSCPPQEAWFARSVLIPRLKGLVTDVFGNHIVQRLIESGTPQQRHAIFLQLQGDILRFSLQTYGCRVLQKALEVMSLEDKLAFAKELHNHVVRCVEDQNGNHVIQKCIERIPPAQMQFVIDSFQGQVARVSVHCYGCRVVQRVLEHCPYEQINGLLDEIMDDFIRLAQDQYGNYVVQHVLRYGRPQDKKVIVDRIAKDLQLLASHKFSSNVVEKCLEVCATEDSRRAIIRAAFGDNNDPRPPIMQMVRDRYANYVVQRMIDVTIQDGQESLIDEVIAKLEKHMPALKKFTYGKHIAAALERLRKQNEDLRSRGTT